MSSVDHHVQTPGEKGLKMKIKRKNVGNSSKTESKHEIVKSEGSRSHAASTESTNPSNSVNGSQDKNKPGSSSLEKDKSPYKSKTGNKKDKNKDKGGNKNSESGNKNNEGGAACGSSGNHGSGNSKVSNGVPSGSGNSGNNAVNGLDEFYQQEPKIGDVAQATIKKESESLDPYDFNTDDDGITLPAKKVKIEKVESANSPMQTDSHHIGVETCTVGVSTEPDCLGPCEPGTSVNLEGIVWHETENGVLVVNVTWRGKTYVGTLLDATKHDWAPPRFNCDSPVSDFETRTPKGRGKRNRGPPAGTPVVEKVIQEGRKLRKGRRGSSNTFQAPPSPAKSDVSSSGGVKRKGRSADIEVNNERAKRCRSSSRGPATPAPEVNLTPNKDGLIECPEPNCSKKYKHMNGLRYHQTHAHLNPLAALNAEEDMDDKDEEDVKPEVNVKSEKKDSKTESSSSEKVCSRATRERDSIEDNIPLKEIAASCRANANRSSPEKNSSVEKSSDKSTEKSSGEKQTEKSDKKMDKNTSGKSDDKKCDSSNTSKHDANSKRKDGVESSANSSANVIVNSSSSSLSSSSSSSSISGKSSTIQNQVFQISGASVAALGANVVPPATNGATKVTQSRTSLVTTPVVTPSGSPPSNPLPITVPAISTPPHAVDFSKTDKSKNKTVTRPIVPAPSPQMIALSSNVSVSHANMSPVSTHAQMSPLLKPIQPKPTIMGEPSNINPALMGLKDKKVKPKKKKENPQQAVSGATNINNNSNKSPSSVKDPSNRDDLSKSDRPAVIKNAANPSRPCDRKDKNPGHGESGKSIVDMSRKMPNMDMSRNSNQTLTPAMNLPKSDQAGNRLTTPSNLMKVNSPLQVSTDRKTPVTDDVQSPAYSDISDANESNGSPQQGDSPSKKESSSLKKSEQGAGSQPPPQDGANVPHYGMYGYYGQSPYMMQPNVPSSQHLSPNTGKPLTQGREGGASTSTEERKQGEDLSKTTIKIEDKDDNKVGKPDGPPQQMNDYHQQQKWFQQFYSQIQTLPPQAQYQYLARYGGYMEPSYQMHMINSDPNLRQQYEKAMEEQKRVQEQQGSSGSNSSNKPEPTNIDSKKSNSRPASREHPMDQQSVMKMSQSHLPGTIEGAQDMKKAIGDRSGDQTLREKQNENHQIMKENIELKSQMDRDRNRYEYDYRKQEEMRRYQMFQQQKLIEQQRLEKRKQEMAASKPPELTSAESPGGKHRPDAIKPEDLVKREHGEPRVRDYRDNNPGGATSGPSKVSPDVKSEDKLRSPDMNPRTPNHSLPTPSPGASSSVQSPGQGAIPYNAYMQYPGAYLQSPHYGQMHFDPGQAMYRNMNPHVLGYAASPYLHPAQMGGQLNYRVSVETEKEKVLDQKSAGSSLEVEKPVDGPSGPNYFGSNHKIHELHDKARPNSHASSPVPQKSVDSSPHSNMEKNREHAGSPPTQRHIHTHHHTHVVGPYPLVHGAALLPPPPQTTPTLPHSFNTK